MGLNSIADLPTLSEFVPGAEVVEALERGLRIVPASSHLGDEPAAGSVESVIGSVSDEPVAIEGSTDSAPVNSDS